MARRGCRARRDELAGVTRGTTGPESTEVGVLGFSGFASSSDEVPLLLLDVDDPLLLLLLSDDDELEEADDDDELDDEAESSSALATDPVLSRSCVLSIKGDDTDSVSCVTGTGLVKFGRLAGVDLSTALSSSGGPPWDESELDDEELEEELDDDALRSAGLVAALAIGSSREGPPSDESDLDEEVDDEVDDELDDELDEEEDELDEDDELDDEDEELDEDDELESSSAPAVSPEAALSSSMFATAGVVVSGSISFAERLGSRRVASSFV